MSYDAAPAEQPHPEKPQLVLYQRIRRMIAYREEQRALRVGALETGDYTLLSANSIFRKMIGIKQKTRHSTDISNDVQ